MDPYLEGESWPTFPVHFAVQIARDLSPMLRPKYVAMTQKYQLPGILSKLGIGFAKMEPDVAVSRNPDFSNPVSVGVQLLEPSVQLHNKMAEEISQYVVEICDVVHRELVTAIELMSPVNKIGPGRRKYLRKRDRILASQAHLLEIDLLRRGRRVPTEEPLPKGSYFVFLSRAIIALWSMYGQFLWRKNCR